jgi:hypothetical protein
MQQAIAKGCDDAPNPLFTALNHSLELVDERAILALRAFALLKELAWNDLMWPLSRVIVGFTTFLFLERTAVGVVIVVTIIARPLGPVICVLIVLGLLGLLVVRHGRWQLLVELRRKLGPSRRKRREHTTISVT